jgi:hypothetical protein
MTDFAGVGFLNLYMTSRRILSNEVLRALSRSRRGLNVADRDLAGATVFLGVEGNLLTFHEAAHAGALERRGVDEHVLAAVVRLDEAEAFLIVVKLNGAGVHGSILSLAVVHVSTARASGANGSVHSKVWRESERAPGSAKAIRPDCPAKSPIRNI